jgi:ABC-2 type transport system permease protein
VRNTLATALRLLKQLVNDPRTLALVLLAPVFVIFLFHAVIESGDVVPRIAVVGDPSFAKDIEGRAEVSDFSDAEAARLALGSGRVDAIADFRGENAALTVDAADPSVSAAASKVLREGLTSRAKRSLPAFASRMMDKSTPRIAFVNGSEATTTFDFLAPVILGFIVFFFTFVLSGIAFLRERTSGTLERIFACPVRRREIVAGYMIGFGAVAVVQTTIAQIVVVGVYGAPSVGGFVPVLAIDLSLAAMALAMGLFLSAFARSEFQMLQFIPLVVVPQVLFSGIFNLRSASRWISVLSDLFPLTYAGRALRDVMVRGRSLFDVRIDLMVVWAFAAVFVFLAASGLRRYRGR